MKWKRSFVSLLLVSSFAVLAVTGIAAFVLPFSIQLIGLHSLIGFVFVGLIGWHVVNNLGHLDRYVRSRTLWTALGITTALTLLFVWQPRPVQWVLDLSGNLGPARERFELFEDEMVFHYSPAEFYKMKLTVRTGAAYRINAPPHVAIWLENQGSFHIKTLLIPDQQSIPHLPYWSFKRNGWAEARREAEENAGADIISSDTPNGSFDPADYILPADPDNPMPYKLLLEVNQPGDDQPSLVYAVEIDNADPRAFQVLDLTGYPQKEVDADTGKESWPLYFVDDRFHSALDLIDSALLRIDRGDPEQ